PEALTLAEILLHAYSAGLVELRVHIPRFALEPGERPVASRLARWQIDKGDTRVMTLLHGNSEVKDPLGRQLIRLLDGTRDRAALRQELAAFIRTQLPAGPDLQAALERLPASLEKSLVTLARQALLEA